MKELNPITGLSPAQEKAISLLVGGLSKTETCKELKIDRSTLYLWERKENWMVYYNAQVKEVQDFIKNGLFGLYEDALQSIEDSIHCDNLSIRLKATIWLLERIANYHTGPVDLRTHLKSKCRKDKYDLEAILGFNQEKYRELCKINDIDCDQGK